MTNLLKRVLAGGLVLAVAACGYRIIPGRGWLPGVGPGMHGGTAWGAGAFDSNGERIYFTGVNEDSERIDYRGGPSAGMMMGGYLSCASCHGPDGQGGRHVMHMELMAAPDIRWAALSNEGADEHAGTDEHAHETEYGFADFRRAVVDGEHPNGEPLSSDMPRWRMGDDDLQDLMDYLMSIPYLTNAPERIRHPGLDVFLLVCCRSAGPG